MASQDQAEAKELTLVSKVEMRIALADSDTKLETLLNTFLPPLLLKLASDSIQVRNKVIAVCQHVNTRIKTQGIKLPVAALLKQFKDNPTSSLIRHFDILYIQQGIHRVDASKRLELLPLLIGGITSDTAANAQHGSQLFHLILQLLHHFKFPPKGSKDDDNLREDLDIQDTDATFLAQWIGRLMLLTVRRTAHAGTDAQQLLCPGLTLDEYNFLTGNGKPETWEPANEGGLSLTETKVVAMKFVSSGLFKTKERFWPAVFASADTNSRLADIGDEILKRGQSEIDFEDSDLVREMFRLYFGMESAQGSQPVRVPVRIKILGYLSRSVKSLDYSSHVTRLVEEAFAGSNAVGESGGNPTGREAVKFHTAIFIYVAFAARHGKLDSKAALELIQQLRAFVEDQGWPQNTTNGDQYLRGQAYESIGLLAKSVRSVVALDPEVGLLRWLFRSLNEDNSGNDTLFSIQEALSSLMSAYPRVFATVEVETNFKALLLSGMKIKASSDNKLDIGRRNVRHVVTRFANHCLPYNDVVARWINIQAVSSGQNTSREVVDEGIRGLSPFWHSRMGASFGPQGSDQVMEADTASHPDFIALVQYVFRSTLDLDGGSNSLHDVTPLVNLFSQENPMSMPHALSYCRLVLIQNALHAAGISINFGDDWEKQLKAELSDKEESRQAIKEYVRNAVRSAGLAAQSIAILLKSSYVLLTKSSSVSKNHFPDIFLELYAICPDDLAPSIGLTSDWVALEHPIYSNDIALRVTGAHAFGLLASHPSSTLNSDLEAPGNAVTKYNARIQTWKDAVGEDLNRVCGAILALGFFFSRSAWRGNDRVTNGDASKIYLTLLFAILKQARNNVLRNATAVAIGQLSAFAVLKPASIADYLAFDETVDKIYEIAKMGSSKAILALGYLSMTAEETENLVEKSSMAHAEKKLRELAELRDAETQFSVGEALSVLASGWDSKALISEIDVQTSSDSSTSEVNLPKQPPRQTTLVRLLNDLIKGCRASKPSLRKASVIWLLCIIQYSGHRRDAQQLFRKCQMALKQCLSDRDDVVQEAASRALSIIYEKGDRDLRDDLVRDLIGMFSDNKTQLSGGNVSEDTQLFEEGALPTGDGSVTTYKDILSLASEVGDSSLVYRFMSLASNNSIWSTRAAFGRFGLSNVLSDSSTDGYLSQNPKVYPKLFRYRFDPNPNVQRSMKDIWDALVKDSSATIMTHFDAIMNDLLKNILAKEWRVREASCAAIADLLQGRSFETYEKYLKDVWGVCFKVLDDIKESVRAAAASLARVLTGILVRSLEAGGSSASKAKSMLEQVLPFLLSPQGLESSAEDVQGLSLATLLDIIKKSDGPSLRPFIPHLIERFIGLLSSLEHQALNYLRLNASKYKLTEQKIDDARLQGVRQSPMMEAIERCLDLLDESSMGTTMQKLQNAIKTSLDLPSKVGASRVLVSLSTRHNFLFRPYADQFLILSERYIKDRNDTVASSFAIAAGYIARIATDKQIAKTINFAKNLYINTEEDRHRLLSGDTFAAMLKHATDRTSIFSGDILPFVFFAKHDSNDQVKELYRSIWEDNAGGSRAVALYLQEILAISQPYLESSKWILKHTSSRAVAGAVIALASTPDDILAANASAIWPALEKAVGGKTWDGKEEILQSFARYVEKSPGYWKATTDVATAINKITLREAKRNNKVYQQSALRAMSKVVLARVDCDLSEEVFGIIEPIAEEYSSKDEEAMDVDGARNMSSSQLKDSMLAGVVDCALSCINPAKVQHDDFSKELSHALDLVAKAASTRSRVVHLAAFESVKSNFERLAKADVNVGTSDAASIRESLISVLLDQRLSDLPEAIRSERSKAVVAVAKINATWVAGPELEQAIIDEKAPSLRQELVSAR